MKTTIEIASGLLADAKRTAAREGTTLRALVEESLRATLDERRKRRVPFKQKLVTVLEIVSPSNKKKGSNGHREFLAKREEIMDSKVHWVEIDLLRKGERTLFRQRFRKADYLVHVSREHQRPTGEVWPIRLREPLPVIKIPLLKKDGDITVDLGEIFRTSYDTAGYDLSINYKNEPVPPLSPEDAAWADALLKKKGLR